MKTNRSTGWKWLTAAALLLAGLSSCCVVTTPPAQNVQQVVILPQGSFARMVERTTDRDHEGPVKPIVIEQPVAAPKGVFADEDWS